MVARKKGRATSLERFVRPKFCKVCHNFLISNSRKLKVTLKVAEHSSLYLLEEDFWTNIFVFDLPDVSETILLWLKKTSQFRSTPVLLPANFLTKPKVRRQNTVVAHVTSILF